MIPCHSSRNIRKSFHRHSRAICIGCCAMALASPFCIAATRHAAPPANSPWVATWGSALVAADPGDAPDFSGKTLRQIVHTSVAGHQARVWFSNQFGTEPLRIGAAHVAISTGNSVASSTPDSATTYAPPAASAVQPGSDHALTFHHRTSVVIPPGATIVSDPVALEVPALSNLAVSTYFPDRTMGLTEHSYADQTSYVATGNAVMRPTLGTRRGGKMPCIFSAASMYTPREIPRSSHLGTRLPMARMPRRMRIIAGRIISRRVWRQTRTHPVPERWAS